MTPDQLKAFRTARKWTQKQLAGELGVGLRTIVRWERGEARIPNMVGQLIQLMGEK
jgi:transcriptional regulator with XRE-family HTH domain